MNQKFEHIVAAFNKCGGYGMRCGLVWYDYDKGKYHDYHEEIQQMTFDKMAEDKYNKDENAILKLFVDNPRYDEGCLKFLFTHNTNILFLLPYERKYMDMYLDFCDDNPEMPIRLRHILYAVDDIHNLTEREKKLLARTAECNDYQTCIALFGESQAFDICFRYNYPKPKSKYMGGGESFTYISLPGTMLTPLLEKHKDDIDTLRLINDCVQVNVLHFIGKSLYNINPQFAFDLQVKSIKGNHSINQVLEQWKEYHKEGNPLAELLLINYCCRKKLVSANNEKILGNGMKVTLEMMKYDFERIATMWYNENKNKLLEMKG